MFILRNGCLFVGGGGEVLHLHLMILPFVPCPFCTPVTGPRSLLGGGGVNTRTGWVPSQPLQDGVPPLPSQDRIGYPSRKEWGSPQQDRMGCPLARTGWGSPDQDRMAYPTAGQDGVPLPRTGWGILPDRLCLGQVIPWVACLLWFPTAGHSRNQWIVIVY